MKRITANVSGRVQGVGYRYFVTDRACEIGVKGYAKNLADGSVEVVAEGTESRLREFAGTLSAKDDSVIRVEGIEIEWSDATGEFAGFGIRR
ncbi:acylphosphatase [Methanolinea mesophila]|uniref:acylphosphatase n=1 Tax=Methanolinea mesophila TaxID=547055 RepID=UPI001AEADCC9|nr:acylphosphatase [Methanolinea mesophila]MBP1929765.1 acylphosphatase [Methanolinea mesophila]